MEKIKNYVNKHDNVFMFIAILLSTIGIAFNLSISNSDEIWNFQNVYKLYNGFIIYKDANVICTPLFFYVGNAVFHIFGGNFLAFRIYGEMMITALFISTYYLLKLIGVEKKESVIITFIFILLNRYNLLITGASYNILALIITIIGIILLIKNQKKSLKNLMFQGLILFLIFMTKQNFGIFYGIGLFIYEFIDNKKTKEKLKNLMIEYISFLILFFIYLCYMLFTNNLYNFINMAFFSISEFGEKNVYINFGYVGFIAGLIFINIFLFFFLIKNKKINLKEKQKKIIQILIPFSTLISLVIIPLVNDVHFGISSYLLIITTLYLLKEILFKDFKINEKIIILIMFFIIGIGIIISSINFYWWESDIFSKEYKYKRENAYYGSMINEKTSKNIEIVDKYIENNKRKVIILSNKAALYMVPLKRNNGKFDLAFKGNLGKDGEEGIIKELTEIKDTEILIEKENDFSGISWQESKKARDYILNNFKQIGEIEEFLIFLME